MDDIKYKILEAVTKFWYLDLPHNGYLKTFRETTDLF